jgi:hypothetical protein
MGTISFHSDGCNGAQANTVSGFSDHLVTQSLHPSLGQNTLLPHLLQHLPILPNQLLNRRPLTDPLPPLRHIRPAHDPLPIPARKQPPHKRHIKHIRQRKLIARHVLLLPEQLLRNIQIRLRALLCLRDHRLVGLQAHELLGELFEAQFAGRIGEVEGFGGQGLVEERGGFEVGCGGEQGKGVFLTQVFADGAGFVQSEAVGELDVGDFAPGVAGEVFGGLCLGG